MDNCAAATLQPPERERAAAVALATLPGATLWHEGQFDGRQVRLPVFLARRPFEPGNPELRRFHLNLIAAVKRSRVRSAEPELFWAIRGGEGNFGIATRFQLRLHEISEIHGGMLVLPASAEVITGFVEAAKAAPEELSVIGNVMLAPQMPFLPEEAHGKPIIIGLMAYVGPVDQAEAVIAPFRGLAEPLADMVRPMRYPELYEGPEQAAPMASGVNWFTDGFEPAAAGAILERLPKSTAMMKAVQLRVLGGALARVPNDATAFAHRDRGLFVNVAAMYADPDEKDTHDAWVSGLADALGRDGQGGYVGFMGEEDEGTIRAAYPGDTWDRLRAVKRRWDPDNLFRLNHNIPPAEG